LEIRFLQCREVTPPQVGFPGARLTARLETRVKRNGKWSSEVVYLVSTLTLDELQAERMLWLKRGYWVIESRLHYCLDITLREDETLRARREWNVGLSNSRVLPQMWTLLVLAGYARPTDQLPRI